MIKSKKTKLNNDTSTLSKVKEFIEEYRRIANSSHAGTKKIKVNFEEQLETAVNVIFKDSLIPAYNPNVSNRRPTTRRQSSDKRTFGYQLPAKSGTEEMSTEREVKRSLTPVAYRRNRTQYNRRPALYFDIVK